MPTLRINGESFTISDSPLQRAATKVALEVAGRDSAELRLVNEGESAPKGRFRWRVEGDRVMLQRATEISPNTYIWPDATTLIEATKDEVAFKVPINLDSIAAFVGNIIDTVPVDVPSVVWLGDGFGPTEEPGAYLAVLVNYPDGPGTGYIPVWRGE